MQQLLVLSHIIIMWVLRCRLLTFEDDVQIYGTTTSRAARWFKKDLLSCEKPYKVVIEAIHRCTIESPYARLRLYMGHSNVANSFEIHIIILPVRRIGRHEEEFRNRSTANRFRHLNSRSLRKLPV